MSTYFLFGKYTPDAVKQISSARTDDLINTIKSCEGEVKEIYALAGEHDIVVIAELPGIAQSLQASVELCKKTGISFKSAPAIGVKEFDNLVG